MTTNSFPARSPQKSKKYTLQLFDKGSDKILKVIFGNNKLLITVTLPNKVRPRHRHMFKRDSALDKNPSKLLRNNLSEECISWRGIWIPRYLRLCSGHLRPLSKKGFWREPFLDPQ